MSVSDRATEAAARGRYAYQRGRLPEREQPEWDDLAPPVQAAYLHEAESALAAACDPALGPDRLVPHGECRAEVVAEITECLRMLPLEWTTGMAERLLKGDSGHTFADYIERRERERTDK